MPVFVGGTKALEEGGCPALPLVEITVAVTMGAWELAVAPSSVV